MFIVLGLGNPGREYQSTRHNVGFMTLDILADRYNIDVCRSNFRSVFGEGRIGAERVVLAKPDTFMNNSGWAARDLVNWYKCENSELIVIYDDIDASAKAGLPARTTACAASFTNWGSTIFRACAWGLDARMGSRTWYPTCSARRMQRKKSFCLPR